MSSTGQRAYTNSVIPLTSSNKGQKKKQLTADYKKKEYKKEKNKKKNEGMYKGTAISKFTMNNQIQNLSSRFEYKYVTTPIVAEQTESVNTIEQTVAGVSKTIGKVYLLNQIFQGVASYQRIGIQTFMNYIQFRGGICFSGESSDMDPGTALPKIQHCRMILFCDQNSNTDYFDDEALEELLAVTQNNGTTPVDVDYTTADKNLSGKKRFVIIKEDFMAMTVPTQQNPLSPATASKDFFVQIKKKHYQKSIYENTGVIQKQTNPVETNAYYLLFLSNINLLNDGISYEPHLDLFGNVTICYREIEIKVRTK